MRELTSQYYDNDDVITIFQGADFHKEGIRMLHDAMCVNVGGGHVEG